VNSNVTLFFGLTLVNINQTGLALTTSVTYQRIQKVLSTRFDIC